ncbi:PucR family transcriptional regulator ligand-binding domain-containing protein [Streptomyces sp. NPDC050982]|uniref:PucR family transcriptional regulator ligand-binding domain-containing protein n=1 Tax=Streptomyces sp. NPDC050982 TaxID=3154746 RepID=UPI0033DB7F10
MTESEQPSVPLSTLLADPALGLRRIAGPAGEHLVRVSTVGMTEIEDPTPYLVGGELLLTAGVRLPRDAEGIDTYVRQPTARAHWYASCSEPPRRRSRPPSRPPTRREPNSPGSWSAAATRRHASRRHRTRVTTRRTWPPWPRP